MGTVKRLNYILKYLLDFKNNLINIGCVTLYHLSITYIFLLLFFFITVYNLSMNSNYQYRILAAELNYRFTEICAPGFKMAPLASAGCTIKL